MTLKEYLSKRGMQTALARACGVTDTAISNVANGKRTPSPDLAKEIWRASNKRVALKELRPDIWGSQ